MTVKTSYARLKTALVFGSILVAIHSLLALAMFVHVYSHRGVAQAEMAWVMFFVLDFPTAQLTFGWLGSTAPMRAVFERGYDLVGSGPNLRAFVMVAIAGGLQWFLIGSVLGAGIAGICARLRLKASLDDKASDHDEEEQRF